MCLGEYRKSASSDLLKQSVEVGIVCLHLVSFAKLGRREDGILGQGYFSFLQ